MHNESDDLEDTHLCIKCNATIVGLEKYIEHRKISCLSIARNRTQQEKQQQVETRTSTGATDHSYDGFHFAEPEAPSSYLRKTTASHGGKTSKSLTEAYDPTYELGADVFFSSLQLQSVSTGGKTSVRPERTKEDSSWHGSSNCTDPLLKAVREQEETDFKPLKFVHSPEASEDEEEDEEPDDFDDDEQDHDDHADEDYDARRHSPPAVPATHTGGKWKPEHRPQLRHTHLERISPSWDDPPEESHDHPPAEHTHGKWVPGSKQLEYRENIDLTKLQQPGASYWCNICCRRLKTRTNYEQHLRSAYHQRRANAERELEQGNLKGASLTLAKDFETVQQVEHSEQNTHGEQSAQSEHREHLEQLQPRRRRRRANLIRCELCRHSMARHLIGKHLISHFHYRRLQQQQTQLHRQNSLHAILEHMGSIVRQSPFQCLPCRFYANTEQAFQVHWRSSSHVELTERLGGDFWCSYCQFQCGSNEEMWQHLLHATHKEVLLALNRSVPVSIAQRRPIQCEVCNESFLYNFHLRRHFATEHLGTVATGSASDAYQSRFRCNICGAAQRSRVALQRHEKHKHHLARYYCALCGLEFETPQEARRHRSLVQHARRQPKRKFVPQPDRDIERMLREVLDVQEPFQEVPEQSNQPSKEQPSTAKRRCLGRQCTSCKLSFETPQALVEHRRESHPVDNHACLSCGGSFQSAQALGRHTRSCRPIASTSNSISNTVSSLHSKSWRCDLCDFSSQYESDLLYHRFFHSRESSIGKNELLQCPRCPKQFRKHSLRAHLRNHSDERIFECKECQAKFARRHNLKNHIVTMHATTATTTTSDATTATATTAATTTEKATSKKSKDNPRQKFQCGICGKILTKKFSLKQHELLHTEVERRFRCHFENCHYAGLTSEALKTHLLSHAEGSYKCSHENCSYEGKSEQHLKRHLKSHVSEKFSCDQCDFKARLKGQLRRHMLRHTGEKSHKCPHCDFQCSTFDNLRKHIIKTGKHPGKLIYECATCTGIDQQTTCIFKSNSFKEYQLHLSSHKKPLS